MGGGGVVKYMIAFWSGGHIHGNGRHGEADAQAAAFAKRQAERKKKEK